MCIHASGFSNLSVRIRTDSQTARQTKREREKGGKIGWTDGWSGMDSAALVRLQGGGLTGPSEWRMPLFLLSFLPSLLSSLSEIHVKDRVHERKNDFVFIQNARTSGKKREKKREEKKG
mmetsp:Transcript_32068/g.63572  ORF Transcript_32068/g.63572 Transcript_32068/m.63572 type:complete len:119 (+) Transcript_32068:946-1302(+)